MEKLKYAYPEGNSLILSESRKNIRPAINDEIEIIKLTKNKLIGNLVSYKVLNLHDIKVEDVEDKYIRTIRKYLFFGEKIKLVCNGWVRMKERTRVELDLRNRIITKVFDTKHNLKEVNKNRRKRKT
jgi:hypothetical protein